MSTVFTITTAAFGGRKTFHIESDTLSDGDTFYPRLTDWEILRRAAAIHRAWHEYEDDDPQTVPERALGYVADHLEAEHHAAQEKAAADARREALIEKVKASLIETWGQSLPSVTHIAADAVDALLAEDQS